MTALWESTLRKVQEGRAPLDGFLHAVRAQLGELVANATGVSRQGSRTDRPPLARNY
jgi:hypothetical protein